MQRQRGWSGRLTGRPTAAQKTPDRTLTSIRTSSVAHQAEPGEPGEPPVLDSEGPWGV
jgi:hypothetical protein